MQLFPYLTFKGQAEAAFNFYKQALGAEVGNIVRYSDMAGDAGLSADMKPFANLIGNSTLTIKGCKMMASDMPPDDSPRQTGDVTINLTPDTKEEAERFFKNLSEGGQVRMPLAPQDWADAFGWVIDKFGVSWYVCYFGSKPAM